MVQCMYQPVRIGGWRRYEALIKRDVNNPYSPVTGEAGWPGPAQSDPHHQCVCTWRAKQALHMQGERFFLPLTTCALGWGWWWCALLLFFLLSSCVCVSFREGWVMHGGVHLCHKRRGFLFGV